MTKESTGKLMNVLITISSLAILAGAIFKLQNWPYGDSLLNWGFVPYFLLSSFEIRRLRKIVLGLEREKRKVD